MSDVPISDPALTLYHALENVGWQQSFDPGSLARGMGYARQGRVREGTRLERQGDLLVLRAQVDGSGRSRYGTNLAVDPGNPEMGVISDCSCPVGRQCKHAVAVIGTFIDEMEANGIPERDATARLEQRWEAWLAEFEAPGAPGIPVDRAKRRTAWRCFSTSTGTLCHRRSWCRRCGCAPPGSVPAATVG